MRARPLGPAVAVFLLAAAGGPISAAAAAGTSGAGAGGGARDAHRTSSVAPAAPEAPSVRADFDNDGAEDLAVGSAFEGAGGVAEAGTVHVLYGTGTGLTGTGSQLFNQASAGIASDPEAGDWFGWSLSTGDYDGDGFTDLAIGVRNESVGTVPGAGVVHVLYGSASGLQATGSQLISQDTFGLADSAEAGDAFGVGLASGDFDGDGADDLAVGSDTDVVGGQASAGLAHVLYGSVADGGLTGVGSTLLSQSGAAVPSEPEPGDQFSFSLAAADFDGDGCDDLAVGVPGESAGNIAGAGAVNVFDGTADGVTTAGSVIFTQDSPGVGSDAERADAFSAALGAGDFDGDGFADLAVGASNEAVGDVAGAGAVNVLEGSGSGLVGGSGQVLHQGVAGIASDPEALDTFGGALAAGDFDDDGADDLAIGVPAESVGSTQLAGAAHVLYGTGGTGLSASGSQLLTQGTGTGAIGNVAEQGDELGFSFAASDFDGDGVEDLAVGAPFESIGAADSAGALHVVRGSGNGLVAAGSQVLSQSTPGIGSDPETLDVFGFSLAAPRPTA
jgi:hypothetical protein